MRLVRTCVGALLIMVASWVLPTRAEGRSAAAVTHVSAQARQGRRTPRHKRSKRAKRAKRRGKKRDEQQQSALKNM